MLVKKCFQTCIIVNILIALIVKKQDVLGYARISGRQINIFMEKGVKNVEKKINAIIVEKHLYQIATKDASATK